MDLNLSGKIALVTGAGSGIGATIASLLAKEKCIVYLADLKIEAAENIRQTIIDEGNEAYSLEMNVANAMEVKDRVDYIINKHGTIDILVNCAGILKTDSIIESTIEDWDQISKVNLSSVYYCSKAVLPIMVEKRYGKIINLSSVSAMKGGGSFGNTLYGTTKAGVIALTKGFARELAPYGINVNSIAPALTETPMINNKLTSIGKEKVLESFPLGRLAKTLDIANLAVFLASDVSSYITGVTIPVDGGLLTKF